MLSQSAVNKPRTNSFVNVKNSGRADSMYRDNESDAQSSVMVREISAYGSRLSESRLSSHMT